jgi:hypothetical protein
MSPRTNRLIQLLTTAVLAAAAIGFVVARLAEARKVGEEGSQIWFYDLSEKQLYAVPARTVPPHKGVGGAKDDGVRAIVVGFRGEGKGARRIAYLEKCTPELKALVEEVRAARAAGRVQRASIPSRDSDFYQENTLIRSPEQDVWYPVNSPEAQRIAAEWRSWQGPAGQRPDIVAP